jgi:rhodanese-related sulfurtransferase
MNARTEVGRGNAPQTTNLLNRAFKNQSSQPINCQISAQQAYGGWSKNQLLLIDVRRSNEFDKFQIPGSLNLPTFSVKSKPYLKGKHIVLVNDGHYVTQLNQECAHLKSLGFNKVEIMSGGLYAWHQAGFPVRGDRFEISKLNRMALSEWISALHERDWKYIDLDKSLPSLGAHLPASAVIAYQANKRDFYLGSRSSKQIIQQQ